MPARASDHYIDIANCSKCKNLEGVDNYVKHNTFRKEWAKEGMAEIFEDVSVEDAKRAWKARMKH